MAKKGSKLAYTTGAAKTTSEGVQTALPEPPAKSQGQRKSLLFDTNVHRAVYLVLLAATYSPLSQLVLSPVFGSIPASVYHRYGVVASAMLAFFLKPYLPSSASKYLPAFIFWVPTIHFVLFKFSDVLGNPIGPLLIECFTTYPVITLSLDISSKLLDQVDLHFLSPTVAETSPAMFNYLVFTIFERTMEDTLALWVGANAFFSRIGMQMMVATTYGLILPGSLFWPALPSIAFTLYGNIHSPLSRTTELLNSTLAIEGFTLIERRESLTGYISVLQDNRNGFRVMRCDHSLLGGEWIMPENSKRRVAEPIYAVFTMLETVRLVNRAPEPHSTGPDLALNIGLGVGTAPSALIAHGINTTIVELDPVVHAFAMKHFNLPLNHSYWIGDAVGVVEEHREQRANMYDYIIHDVFTGGAEPVPLFTYEFFSGLRQMLKPNGVIAINYAGDLSMPSTSLIYRTITELFPSCRVFREDEQISQDGVEPVAQKEPSADFTNLIFICTKNNAALKFRKAVEADYLGSASRKMFMVPKFEVPASKFDKEGELLTRANMRQLEKLHVTSAIGHWKLMRKVLPPSVWENW